MSEYGRNLKSPFGQLLEAISQEYRKLGPWTDKLQRDLPKKWEKHGDMVLLPENAFTLPEWRMLGRQLWQIVAESLQVQRVGRKRRIEKDDYRTPHIELLFGKDGWVEHIDNGVRYQYDVTKCMFSIGNITEKIRIASMDCKGETVVDMFSGIGYFTLPYLVHAKAQMVHACEWNVDAIEALRRNLDVNKVGDRCVIYEGDCRKVCPVGVADRVNLGLLPTARQYWLTACKALKHTGGILHVHENVTSVKLKKSDSLQRQDSSISDHGKNGSPAPSDPLGTIDAITAGNGLLTHQNGESETSEETTEKRKDFMERRKDSLFEEVDDYDPRIDDSFLAQWQQIDAAWHDFSIAAARRIRRFLNNLHDSEWDVTILRVGKIKSYAPRIDHVVLDLKCSPRPA